MSCPRCGADIRPGQKFCAECGLALATSCPNCGTPYEGSPKFCPECGHSLPQQAADEPAGTRGAPAPGDTGAPPTGQPASERRYVTILFADLVGFTQLSEAEDPEEVRELLSRYFDFARQTIESYGGNVEKFIGDAVMAVWGAPVARENDAELAVRAALELVDRVRGLSIGGQQLALRAGVLSGEAAVTPGRTGEGMVAGDLVNTASRLQSVAPPGTVLVGEATYSATSAAVAYESAGEQLLKGKQAPVAAWRALRVVARVGGEGRDEGLEPPFVGRAEELRLLKDQLHAAEREGRLRMVAIMGQAGIGKSRLIWELEKYLDGLAAGPTYYWHRGRSPSYGEGVAFWALGEMVRRRARIAEGEDEATTRAKLDAALAEFVPETNDRRTLAPALGALLGIDEADWAAREQLFAAWRTFFERVSEAGPTVLAFEDLQWADDGLLDFIEHLLDWARERPILIVTLARPELLERRPGFGMSGRATVALHLEPLSDEAMTEMLRGLVPTIGDADLATIVKRAEGIPLYAVETVRALLDGGQLMRRGDVYELVGELPVLEVPPTLRALIAARLDALEGEDRTLLQDAAVLGLAFSMGALAALSGREVEQVEQRMRALAQKELVGLETDPRSPERGQFIFRQGLIREIAYGTLSKRERRARHLGAARYYETLSDDELAGVLATHYVEAFRAAPEGEEGAAVAAQARVALRAAADRAARLHSHQQALDYFERAMAVTFDDGELDDLKARAFTSASIVGDVARADQFAGEVLASLDRRGELERAAVLRGQYGGWLLSTSRIDEAMEMLQRALDELPPEMAGASIALNGQLARGHLFRVENELGLAAVTRALDAAEQLGIAPGDAGPTDFSVTSTLHLLITKSWALGQASRPFEGEALLYGAMAMADRAGETNAQIRARYNLGSSVIDADPREALRISLEGVALARQHGQVVFAAMVSGNAADAALWLGDLDTVFKIEADLPTSAQTSLASFVHGAAAIAAALRGDDEGARDRMALVEQHVADSTSMQDRAAWLAVSARLAFARGEFREARRLGVESVATFSGGESAGAFFSAAHSAVMLGDLAALQTDAGSTKHEAAGAWVQRSWRTIEAGMLALEGRGEESMAAYRRVIDDWRAADLPYDLGLALLERWLLLRDLDPDAAAGLEEARAIFAAMGADGFVDRLIGAAQAKPVAARKQASGAVRTVGQRVGTSG